MGTILILQRKFHWTGRVDIGKASGKVTTPAQDRQMIAAPEQNRFNTATATASRTNGTHGIKTVLIHVLDQGIRARRPFRGLILTPHHRLQRERWARQHLRMTRAEWANILFTTVESRFNLFYNDGKMHAYRRRCERLNDDCIFQREHYGDGSVMVWGGVSLNSKTDLLYQRTCTPPDTNRRSYCQ